MSRSIKTAVFTAITLSLVSGLRADMSHLARFTGPATINIDDGSKGKGMPSKLYTVNLHLDADKAQADGNTVAPCDRKIVQLTGEVTLGPGGYIPLASTSRIYFQMPKDNVPPAMLKGTVTASLPGSNTSDKKPFMAFLKTVLSDDPSRSVPSYEYVLIIDGAFNLKVGTIGVLSGGGKMGISK